MKYTLIPHLLYSTLLFPTASSRLICSSKPNTSGSFYWYWPVMIESHRSGETTYNIPWIISVKVTPLHIWLLHDHAYLINPWGRPSFKCDWFFNSAHQETILLFRLASSQQAQDLLWMNKGKCQWCVAYLLGKQLPPSAILVGSTCTCCEINYAFNFYQTRKWAPLSVCFECRTFAEVFK